MLFKKRFENARLLLVFVSSNAGFVTVHHKCRILYQNNGYQSPSPKTVKQMASLAALTAKEEPYMKERSKEALG